MRYLRINRLFQSRPNIFFGSIQLRSHRQGSNILVRNAIVEQQVGIKLIIHDRPGALVVNDPSQRLRCDVMSVTFKKPSLTSDISDVSIALNTAD